MDQNVYSHILDAEKADWRQGELATLLLAAAKSDKGQVWAGPTNVIETLQTTDVGRRRELAMMMLELIDARRMWWGHEFEAIQDFYHFLETFAPQAIRYDTYFQHHGTTARQIWLGALGLVAARGVLNDDRVIANLKRTKLVNRLIHARIATNPASWIEQMIAATDELKASEKDIFQAIDALSEEQMEAEITQLAEQARKIGKDSLKQLNENRDRIARAYGAFEVGLLMRSICTLPMEIELTFNIPHLVARWPEMQKKLKCEPLPEYIRTAPEDKLFADSKIIYDTLRLAIRAAARAGLLTGYLGYQVILRELQQCMNDKVIPTGGLTFDADHAAALARHHIFVCQDVKLAESLKTMAKKIYEWTHGQWNAQVVSSPKQLGKALGM